MSRSHSFPSCGLCRARQAGEPAMPFSLVGFSSAKQPFAASTKPRPGSPFPALELWSVACQVERKPVNSSTWQTKSTTRSSIDWGPRRRERRKLQARRPSRATRQTGQWLLQPPACPTSTRSACRLDGRGRKRSAVSNRWGQRSREPGAMTPWAHPPRSWHRRNQPSIRARSLRLRPP